MPTQVVPANELPQAPQTISIEVLTKILESNIITHEQFLFIQSNQDPDAVTDLIKNLYDSNLWFRLLVGGPITVQEMQKMIATYNSERRNTDDSMCCWFSLPEIFDFLLKNNFITKGQIPSGKENFGVRIYFGVHFTGSDTNKLAPILVPTQKEGTINLDIAQFSISVGGSPFNHGDLCPDVCDGALYRNCRLVAGQVVC